MLDLSPGSVFADQFEVVRPLARGGMGAVYVVKQLGTGRERALKLMHPMLVSDDRSLERFEREAKVGSEIESDHVVEVIAAGVDRKSSTPWLCMELLKGETLAERMERQGPLSRGEAIEALEQLAHALGAAHRAGIVHRDLKPENLFLAVPRRQGIAFTLKVLDFGVAALVKEAASTKTTQGVGSPMWMAPEQTDLGKVTRATDVWAVGLIAYFALTGSLYWKTPRKEGASLTALLVEIMVEPLSPPSERARDAGLGDRLPGGFDGWFARCVARDPGARFQDVEQAIGELVAMLRAGGTASVPPRATVPQAFEATALATGPLRVGEAPVPAPVPVPVPAAPKRRIWPWVLGGVGAVMALGCGVVAWGVISGARAIGDAVAEAEGPHLELDDGHGRVHFGADGVRLEDPDGHAVIVGDQGALVVLPDGGTIALGAMRPIEQGSGSGTGAGAGTETVTVTETGAETGAGTGGGSGAAAGGDGERRRVRSGSGSGSGSGTGGARRGAGPYLAAAMPVLRRCWEGNLPAGAPATRVRLALMLGPGGGVQNVRFEDAASLDARFRSCVVTNASSIRLDPPPPSDEVSITATLGR